MTPADRAAVRSLCNALGYRIDDLLADLDESEAANAALTVRVAELEACLADIGRHNEPGGEGQ